MIEKNEILIKVKKFYNDKNLKNGIDLIKLIDTYQLIVVNQKRFRCHSSLLGLQSQIIEDTFFNKKKKNISSNILKNCKF